MLTVHHVSKSFGSDQILKDISFNLSRGERLGLVGPNGSGKTTLLRILAGEDQPDAGSLQYASSHLRVGYLPQGLSPAPGDTLAVYLTRILGDPAILADRLETLAHALGSTPNQPGLQEAYDETLAQLEIASQQAARIPAVVGPLGLGGFSPETPVSTLSGGQKTRLALAGVLLSTPQLLLLDEPTNHLDIEMLEWLEAWLTSPALSARTAALIVSHDRAFLDITSTGILELDLETHSLRVYAGNYTAYLETKLAERERRWQEYKDQQEEIARLERAARLVRADAAFKVGGKGDSGDKFAKGFFANRTKETIHKAKNIEKRLDRLLNEDRIDKPRQGWQMKLDFGEQPPSGKDVLALEDLSIGYETTPLLSHLNAQVRAGARVVLTGPNGIGKTTLLRTIAGALPPLDGRVRLGASVRIGYMRQEQEDLSPDLDAFTTIRNLAPLSETDARAFLHQFLFAGDDVWTPVRKLSYGERARLSLACLVGSGCNLLLLDEPINHLDIPSRSRFEQALAGYEGTVLAVVHDRFFIEGFASEIWEIHTAGLHRQEVAPIAW